MITFEPWPKLPRLNKPVIVTEKIDGTNAAIIVEKIVGSGLAPDSPGHLDWARGRVNGTNGTSVVAMADGDTFLVGAQSRNKLIQPGGSTDNAGFAGWVAQHALDLVTLLGPGRHFGEWWGRGIQRGYDQPAKRFSLFNVSRYADMFVASPLRFDDETYVNTVPYLGETTGFEDVMAFVEALRIQGSAAAPGYDRPEGVVAFHTAGQSMFKAFLENDNTPKGVTR